MLFNQVVHSSRLDAAVRLAAIFVPALLTGLSLNPSVLAILSIAVLALTIIIRVPLSDLFRIAVPMLLFCAVTLLMHLLFSQSADSVRIVVGPLNFNQGALFTGLLYCWRIVLFFGVAVCFVRWIGQEEFAELVWRTLSPFGRMGLPAQGIGMAVTIAIRFIPQILSEHRRIEMAQRARGAQVGRSYFRSVKRFIPMLIPTMASALRRIDTTANALTVRAWGVYPTRTFHRRRSFGIRDAAMLLAIVVLVVSTWVLSQ